MLIDILRKPSMDPGELGCDQVRGCELALAAGDYVTAERLAVEAGRLFEADPSPRVIMLAAWVRYVGAVAELGKTWEAVRPELLGAAKDAPKLLEKRVHRLTNFLDPNLRV